MNESDEGSRGIQSSRRWKDFLASDLGVLVLIAAAWVVIFLLVNTRYGFHRDELAFIDEGRHLDWGFVEYPPLAPFVARIAWELFGPSLVGLRFFVSLASGISLVLAGLMAREMGGSRRAQVTTALIVAIAPIVLSNASLFTYETFNYLWWVLTATLALRLINTGDPRWWLGIGAAIGLGMMTKYTMIFLVVGIALGVLLTPARRTLKSPWLWGGAALALLIFLPNAIWQVRHDFISLRFLGDIHSRDVAIGRTSGFLLEQLYLPSNPASIPLWIGGLIFLFRNPAGKRYRLLGWMAVIPFLLFLIAQGRGYYTGPIYPMLIAAGAAAAAYRPVREPGRRRSFLQIVDTAALAFAALFALAVSLPLAPVNSAWWNLASSINVEFKEQIGWPELVQTTADIYSSLPAEEKSKAGILTGNYGEAGAVDLYGPAYGLPRAISGINSYWLRGYGDPPPETLIVLGLDRRDVDRFFKSCTLAGHTWNAYGVMNEETSRHPDIFVCRDLRQSWPEFWKSFQYFG